MFLLSGWMQKQTYRVTSVVDSSMNDSSDVLNFVNVAGANVL